MDERRRPGNDEKTKNLKDKRRNKTKKKEQKYLHENVG